MVTQRERGLPSATWEFNFSRKAKKRKSGVTKSPSPRDRRGYRQSTRAVVRRERGDRRRAS